jgi:hypothetical protein
MPISCCRLRYGAVGAGLVPETTALKRTAINNSLLDLVETSSTHHGYTSQDRPLRRGSVGSLGKLLLYRIFDSLVLRRLVPVPVILLLVVHLVPVDQIRFW